MAIWSRLTAAISGFGIGGAASTVAGPIFEVPRQKAWQGEPNRILGLSDLAQLVATGLMSEGDAVDDAARNGFKEDKLRARIQLFLRVPGIGELDAMLNRGTITVAQFRHALGKHGIEAQYWDAIQELLDERLDLAQIAAAIHRGLIPDPGLLQGEQPKPPFNVEAYPVYPIDGLQEARDQGYDRDHLGVAVGLQGLPMGPHEAAQAVFRNVITWGDYIRAFNTSNNRNEWARALFEQTRQIPTARDFLENALRGYRTLDEAIVGAALHGMSAEHATLLYQNQGRPMNMRQITQALSRGATFHPEPGEIKDPYEAAVVEGMLKPGYYEMAKALRYTLPSPFVMRSLTASGVWSEAKCAQRLKDIGWIPGDADQAAAAWAAETTGTAATWVAKATTHLWTTTHTSYKTGEIDEAAARENLVTIGVNDADRDAVIHLWTQEALTIRKQLTITDLKHIYKKPVLNLATGNFWTRDEVLTAIVNRGYSLQDAASLIETWNA